MTFSQSLAMVDEKRRGIDDLRWAFLFLIVGAVLSIVPFVGGVGGIFDLVALIFFIIGWRALGRSTLAEAPRYTSTGNWIIYSIIIAIVVAFIGFILVFISFLFTALAPGGLLSSPQDLNQTQAFRNFFGQAFIVVLGASLASVFAWYKIITSLMKLAIEVSQPRLRTTGWLLAANAIIGFISLALLSTFFYTGLISPPAQVTSGGLGPYYGPYYYAFTGPGWDAFLLLGLVTNGILILASYMGYRGTKGAF